MRARRGRRAAGGRRDGGAWRGAPRRASLVPVVGSAAERLREPSPPRPRSIVVVVRPEPGKPSAAGALTYGNPKPGCRQKPLGGDQRPGEDVRRRPQLAD